VFNTITSDVVSAALPPDFLLLDTRSNALPQRLRVGVGLPYSDQQVSQLWNRERLVHDREHVQHPMIGALELIELNLPVASRLGK
jgi:hypothetical protein